MNQTTSTPSTSPYPPPQQDLTFKILLIGDSGTGKSSLLLRFTDDTFLEEEMSATIGVDFKVHYLSTLPSSHLKLLQADRMKLSIWDTAGQERFRTLTSSYYRGTQGVILVYDVTQRETFDHLKDTWLPELESYTIASVAGSVVKMVVGNKVDKEASTRQVTKEEGAQFAKENGALFLECSAKTKLGVQQAFEELCLKIIETPELYQKKLSGGGESSGKVNLHSANSNAAADDQDSCSC